MVPSRKKLMRNIRREIMRVIRERSNLHGSCLYPKTVLETFPAYYAYLHGEVCTSSDGAQPTVAWMFPIRQALL